MKFLRWLALALAIRLIASRTNIGTGHPDEWFQTVEFGNYLAFGFQSQTNEFFLHLRNLTWPMILSLPLRMTDWFGQSEILDRLSAIKITTGLLDLGIIWGLHRLLNSLEATQDRFSEKWRQFAYALFILCWFTVSDSVRPSQEHLSAIAFWLCIGFSSKDSDGLRSNLQLVASGIMLVLIGAFRYPSGLLSVGVFLGFMLHLNRKELGWTILGVIGGCLLGGLSDWAIYGRPWESFWMYFQYNVLTGLSSSLFGSQSVVVYWDYFRGAFSGVLIPLGLAVLIFAPIGLWTGIKQKTPWSFAWLIYVIGHSLISHKEPRFMSPILLLTLWSALYGAHQSRETLANLYRHAVSRRALQALAALCMIGNGVLLLKALWGDTWKLNSNYLVVDKLLKKYPSCAVITVRRPVGTLLPWSDPNLAPEPALAFFPAPRHSPSSQSLDDRPLLWVSKSPSCQPTDRVLLQPQRTESYWTQQAGCEILSSGVLSWVPPSKKEWFINQGWVSAPWYSCPADILSRFSKQEVRMVLGRQIPRLTSLPPPGLDGNDFLKWAWAGKNEKDPQFGDSTFGDW